MIYPETFEQKTGFASVRADILDSCSTDEGRRRAVEMDFSAHFDTVSRRLGAVAEMLEAFAFDDIPAIERVRPVGSVVSRLRVPGSYASVAQLADLRSTLEAINDICRFMERHRAAGTLPLLCDVGSGLAPFPECLAAINRLLDPRGEIRDNASPDLAECRQRLRRLQGSMATAMRRVVARAVEEGLVEPDTSPAMRDGRLVIPVAPMYKRKISGIVHDESASGKTIFIEPAEIVESNNRIRELQIEEQRIIVRLLTELADTLRPSLPAIQDALEVTGHLDFIMAKARYARTIGGELPNLADHPEIEWYHAVNPVLQKALHRQGGEAVPLDIHLTPESRLLVISGPNAGGKSVCIATVALVQYMLQCGVLPPLYTNSHAGIFESILLDFGDNQSIDDSLSTYSSHLRNLKAMLREASPRSLVIVDEMGSGTEPGIGGAIAQAVLTRLNEQGTWGVIATHFQNLKVLASDTPGLLNGSMLYDRQAMKPLFKLSVGSPGSSFALEIAHNVGLPADVIEQARELAGSDYMKLDRYMRRIARDKHYWESKREAIRVREKRIEQQLEQYRADAEELRRQRREIVADARREAEAIVAGSSAAVERAILDIRRSQAEREATRRARASMNAELGDLSQRLTDVADHHPVLDRAPAPAQPSRSAKPKAKGAAEAVLTVGSVVKLEGQPTPGRIISIEGKKATVAFGMLKTTVSLDRLKPSNATISTRPSTPGGGSQISAAMQQRRLDFKPEIDVRGMRVDEALQAVTYFIDDAVQFNAGRVRILHGTGTGALRQALREYLATIPAVRSSHDEDVRFGGAGITVVDL